MRKLLIIFILLLQSCGWLDEHWEEQDIIGGYKIITDPNDKESGYILGLATKVGSGYGYRPMIDNCNIIYLDSTNMYVESILFNGNRVYSNVFFDLNDKSIRPFEIKEISKQKFEDIISKCETCSFHDLKNETI